MPECDIAQEYGAYREIRRLKLCGTGHNGLLFLTRQDPVQPARPFVDRRFPRQNSEIR
jgi:hypothetical protein